MKVLRRVAGEVMCIAECIAAPEMMEPLLSI
jgi:hypothetical protein